MTNENDDNGQRKKTGHNNNSTGAIPDMCLCSTTCIAAKFNAFANDYIFGMFNNETENVRQAATVRYQFEKS